MNQLKKKLKQSAFESSYGTLVFYRIRLLREKLALARYNDESYIRAAYKNRFGRDINLKYPETYTEKLQWLKLFYRNESMPTCADKFAVHEYLTKLGYGYLLNELLGVYDNANDIKLESLPGRFVAKANHGSSWNLICKDKARLNWSIWRKIMNTWLKMNLYVFGREWNYKDISPKIVVEKFLDFEPLIDYKFMCFNGEPKYMQINNDFEGKHYVDFYDIEWNKVDFTYKNYTQSNRTIDKPVEFDEMIILAKKLSKPFPYVRVDFYNNNKEIIFGEMTFFPGGGLLPLVPTENNYDEMLGSQLTLPSPNHNLELYNQLQEL